MIENYLGEAIYGYDFYNSSLNESQYLLWLQKEDSNEKLSLDLVSDINFGLPKVKIKVENLIGIAGGIFDGLPEVENRVFSFKTFFSGNNYKFALNKDRFDFIMKWFEFDKNKKMFLYWHLKDVIKTYKIEIRASIDSEKYKKFIIAEDINIQLTSQKSYFEDVEETVVENSLIEGKNTIIINNNGIETPFKIELNTDLNYNFLSIKTNNGIGFESNLNFPKEKSLIIYSNGSVLLDNIVLYSFFSKGTTFNLKNGKNILYIQASLGTIKIKYRERIK